MPFNFKFHAPQNPLWFLIYLIIIFNFFFFALAIILYPEDYWTYFWDYDVSDLGATVTPNGIPNPVGSVMFITILILDGLSFIFFSLLTAKEPINFGIAIKRIKALMLFIVGISCFMVAAPTNLYHTIHVNGAIILFLTLWLLLDVVFLEMRTSNKKLLLVAVLLVNGAMIAYLYVKSIHYETSMFQKITFLAFLISGSLIPILDKQSKWGPVSLNLIFSETKAHLYDQYGHWDNQTHHFLRADYVPRSQKKELTKDKETKDKP